MLFIIAIALTKVIQKGRSYLPSEGTLELYVLYFSRYFVLLCPASRSNQEEMLGSSEECILVDCRLDSFALLLAYMIRSRTPSRVPKGAHEMVHKRRG